LKIFHGRERLLSLSRAAGDRGAVIDYRHLIAHLLRKPGAFEHYVHRQELLPDSAFRLAYDRLVADHGERAGRLEYLHLLKRAAELGEAALSSLVGQYRSPAQPRKWTVAGLRRALGLTEGSAVPDVQLEPGLASYDARLTRIFHAPHETATDCRRRREEAKWSAPWSATPPDVGAYSGYEISRLSGEVPHGGGCLGPVAESVSAADHGRDLRAGGCRRPSNKAGATGSSCNPGAKPRRKTERSANWNGS
jgi:hypothetical protein